MPGKCSKKRLVATIALSALLAMLAEPGVAAAQSNHGDAAVVHMQPHSGGVLSNRYIAAEWQVKDGRLTGVAVRDQATGKSLELAGPFALAFKASPVLHAADLLLIGDGESVPIAPQAEASRYSDRLPGTEVRFHFDDPAKDLQVEYALILREGSHYIRQRLTVTALGKPAHLSDIVLIDTRVPGISVAGIVAGSPLVAGDFFLGFEQPLSQSSVVDGHGVSELQSGVPLEAGQTAEYTAVVGVATAGQMRRDFLAYLERERAHPYRTFLHYNSWFDIGFFTPYSQQDALDRIHAYGEQLNKKRGVVLDSFLFDDGWDDHNDLWKIRTDFKGGFEPLQEAAAKYGTAPGVWLSPWGGYGPPKQERLAAARKGGYEIVDGGLALSGPKYYPLFHDAVMEMVTKYGVNQFKLDGTGNANSVVKGSKFSSDFDAAIHLIQDIRKAKPDMYINLTTGTQPSPFWLSYADSIWRGGEDTNFAGVGTYRERWITYRDADTYDEIVKAGRLYPLNSLMLHGMVYAKLAPHLGDDPGNDFPNEVHSYFGSGTQLQEMYITPSLMTPANWDMLAEAAKWSRANAAVLVDTHWVGGDPRWLAVYGWASWSPKKAILTLRNPSDKPQDFALDIGDAFELPNGHLPNGAARSYTARSPWAADAAQPAIELHAGESHTFHLQPFQVLTLEASPHGR